MGSTAKSMGAPAVDASKRARSFDRRARKRHSRTEQERVNTLAEEACDLIGDLAGYRQASLTAMEIRD